MYEKLHLNYILSIIAGVFVWIQTNFGTAFFILLGLLVLDFLLNYAYEKYYLEKMAVYLISSGAALYVQNAAAGSPELAKIIIIGLTMHEVAQVSTSVKNWIARRRGLTNQEKEMADNAVDVIADAVVKKIQNPKTVAPPLVTAQAVKISQTDGRPYPVENVQG